MSDYEMNNKKRFNYERLFEWGTVASMLLGAGYCAIYGNSGNLFESLTLMGMANILVRVL